MYMILDLCDNEYIIIRVYVCMHELSKYGWLCVYDSSPVGQYVCNHRSVCVYAYARKLWVVMCI